MGAFTAAISAGPYWFGVAVLSVGCLILCT